MGVLRVNVGGTWLDVGGGGGGSDEVVVGPDDPISTVPTTELWYDTDDPTGTTLASIEILYSEITADVTISATSAATANSVINPGNVTYDGTPVMIEFFSPGVRPSTVLSSQTLINLFDGNTDLGYIGQVMTPAASTMITPVHSYRRLTPTPGAHNYNIRSWVSPSGSGLVGAGLGNAAATFAPSFLRVSKPIAGGAAIVPPAGGLEVNRPPAAGALMGLRYFATDTLRYWLCDGTGWIIMAEPEQPWVPTIAGITVGNGTRTGGTIRSNGWVDVYCSFTLGSTSAVTGDLVLTLPISGSGTINAAMFRGHSIGGTESPLLPCSPSAGQCYFRAQSASGAYVVQAIVSSTVPFTWATGNSIYFAGRYPMASRYS